MSKKRDVSEYMTPRDAAITKATDAALAALDAHGLEGEERIEAATELLVYVLLELKDNDRISVSMLHVDHILASNIGARPNLFARVTALERQIYGDRE